MDAAYDCVSVGWYNLSSFNFLKTDSCQPQAEAVRGGTNLD